jgi:hypothetical protein
LVEGEILNCIYSAKFWAELDPRPESSQMKPRASYAV